MENKSGEMTTDALRLLIASEDKRYEQRFVALDKTIDSEVKTQKTAMETALVAQKTAMETAFTAAEKVSGKTEHATGERFKAIDTTLEQVRVQNMTFIPRQEWSITVDNFAASIKKIEAYQSQSIGAENYGLKNRSNTGMIVTIIISAVATIISMVAIFTH